MGGARTLEDGPDVGDGMLVGSVEGEELGVELGGLGRWMLLLLLGTGGGRGVGVMPVAELLEAL